MEENSNVRNDFSGSEDEFEFNLYSDNLAEININENGYSEGDIIYDIIHRSRKARPIESKTYDNASTSSEDDQVNITENGYVPLKVNFSIGAKIAGPQISSNIFEPIQFFKLFFSNQLVDEIIKETNNHAKSVLESKNIAKDSI